MAKRLVRWGLVALITTALPLPVAAEDQVKGDIEYGEYLSSECVACHQTKGHNPGIPQIAGMNATGMVAILKAYKAKELENATMQTIAARLDDEQMAALAVFYASLPAE
jgi:cytochrome c